MKRTLLSLMLLMASLLSFAHDFEVNGIYYNILSESDLTCQVTYKGSSKGNEDYTGSVVIPAQVSYAGKRFSVMEIGKNAFYLCYNLKSITIGNSVMSIGDGAFQYCTDLVSITIPNSVTSIGISAFRDCIGLTSITIPNGVTSIGESAFWGCSGLTSITIPNSVTSIGEWAFRECTSLSSITIPNGVTSIGQGTFYGCSGLTNITIPNSVTSIGGWAFQHCTSLTTLTIPNSVMSIGWNAFGGCKLYPLYFKSTPSKLDSGVFEYYDGDVLAPSKLTKAFVTSWNRFHFFTTEGDDWENHAISLMQGVTFNMPYFESILKCKNLKFRLSDGTQLSYKKSDDGHYTISGLKIATSYVIIVSYTDGDGVNKSCEFTIKTDEPSVSASYTSTQSTVTINKIYSDSDETCTPGKTGILYDGVEYTRLPIVITDLRPDERIYFNAFGYYGGIRYTKEIYVDTQSLTQTLSSPSSSSPSSLLLHGSYTEGDAEITDEKITINGKTYSGNSVAVTGLDPNTQYTATYSLMANGKEFRKEASFTTAGLQMKTRYPKVISVGNVIVAAESNLDDAETNVGFEWRRTDWPDDFNSNTGAAYLYNGQMEGYIRNLYAEKLWRYRPYYLSDSGIYYYGDWVGIDPTNTSYFEATVHTYSQITVDGNTALVKGYALRGTDDIKVQGFVYWKRVSRAKGENGKHYITSVPSNAMMVEAKGQIMTATLSDLDYSSEYCYAAFVTTSAGETFYGEEMTFQTEEGIDPTGINDIEMESPAESAVYIMGYYDLNGRSISKPQRGMNIIRYSDGTSRKVLMK